jgi:uncharacterized membrane protein YecN with MAPEG domain
MMQHIAFITPIYAGFFGIMMVVLSWRVTALRRKYEGNKMRETGHNELTAAVRARDNIVEYLPLALLLMWMLETMQFNPLIIHALGILLIIARLLHLHGLNEPSGDGFGRKLGTRLTWAHIVACASLGFAGSFGIVF